MRSIRKSHVPTVSFRFERQIAEEGSRAATRATAPRRGLRVAALGNPYRAEKDCFWETCCHFARNKYAETSIRQLHTTDSKGITFKKG
ncbi:hypothetical protein RCS94_08820 [Orbaceae bacterium ac157xtp]